MTSILIYDSPFTQKLKYYGIKGLMKRIAFYKSPRRRALCFMMHALFLL